jgi:hypothetical protein
MKWLLRNKVVCDFRGFPIGRVKKLWYDDVNGPLVIVERSRDGRSAATWEAIPLRAIDTVRDEVRLKPPVFAE